MRIGLPLNRTRSSTSLAYYGPDVSVMRNTTTGFTSQDFYSFNFEFQCPRTIASEGTLTKFSRVACNKIEFATMKAVSRLYFDSAYASMSGTHQGASMKFILSGTFRCSIKKKNPTLKPRVAIKAITC